jgi:peptidoglycan/LPS O-acetylase OafA/YrhL
MSDAKRFDIQVLRGLAVASVILFHAFKAQVAKGFLGVDVFFVISGFLISGIILRQLEAGTFSFIRFYMRRVRRLLPAVMTTLLATSIAAVVLLTPTDLRTYATQLLGAIGFYANFVFAISTGYFDGAAETKPLLHIWSLSLEEQYYFVMPVLLWSAPLRTRPWLLAAGTVLSLALCLALASGISLVGLQSKMAMNLAFYMLPARGWELLIGSIAAWVMLRMPSLIAPRWVKRAALAVILLTCARGVATTHPGPDAIIATCATALILVGRDDWLWSNLVTRALGRVGDWSYSLYLVHWPLFCFAYIAWLGEPPAAVMAALIVLAVVLGWMQYQFVEVPFQAGKRLWPIATMAAASVAICGAGLATMPVLPDSNNAPITGLATNCEQHGDWRDRPECRTGPAPTILLWGDSYAQHLVPGLEDAVGRNIVQATMPACTPAIGVAQRGGYYPEAWARECLSFNQAVAAHLRAMPTVRHVILASSYTQIFSDYGLKMRTDDAVLPWSPTIAIDHVERSVRAIQAAGKIAVVIGPTPIADFDVGACNDRVTRHRLVMHSGGCDVPRDHVIVTDVDRQLRQMATRTGAILLLPTDVMCDARVCRSSADGVSLYHDRGHLTLAGSRRLITKLRLMDVLKAHP